MNKHILDKTVQQYITRHLNSDLNEIVLSKNVFEEISSPELANQISAKKKAEKKLPSWYNTDNIYYPSTLSIEQTSSEITAQYKANLITGNSLIDLTGGFGVDCYYFSKKIASVIHCEIDPELSEIARHNAKTLKADNIVFKAIDGLEFLATTELSFDTIYIDPARRAEKGKVFMLKDCTPDVVSNIDLLLSKTKRLIIKTAPLLDITAGLNELKQVSEIHIVSVKNECKEILWVIDQHFTGTTQVIASTLNQTKKEFAFLLQHLNADVNFTKEINIGDYLYEPDVALLKSGAFNLIAEKYKLSKLHQQTQLYSSELINSNFAGRIFKIEAFLSSAELKKQKGIKANIITRNYPAKAEELAKKFKISSSKDDFLIFTKTKPEKNLIIKAKIVQYY